jgi:hypothetical protein
MMSERMLDQESGVEDNLACACTVLPHVCMYFALAGKFSYPLGCLGQCHVSQLPASSQLSLLKGKDGNRHCLLGCLRGQQSFS